jgi:hypothetical protein
MKRGHGAVCRVLIAAVMWLSFDMSHAGIISTQQMIASEDTGRARLTQSPGRAEVAARLEALGVSAEAALERAATLTDEEVAALAGGIEALPAGGAAVFWIVLAAVVAGLALWWRGALPPPAR